MNGDGFGVPPRVRAEGGEGRDRGRQRDREDALQVGRGPRRWDDTGYDCSGSVSFALHGAGLLDSPLVSGDFARWGDRGPGSWITIYANAEPRLHGRAGMRFDTSARSRTGSRWTMERAPRTASRVTHPAGL